MNCREICQTIHQALSRELHQFWDGQESILFMRDNGCHHWRQMEWPGFFFQFRCERILSGFCDFQIPGPQYGKVQFDGLHIIPWDFKVHTNNTGQALVPTNGYQEMMQALETYGKIGFIIACGDAEYDHDGSFKQWHDLQKGSISDYELERIRRHAPSRRRKVNFSIQSIDFVFVDPQTIGFCGRFQAGMRNSNGTPRNPKVMLNLQDNRLEHYSLPFA